MRAECDRTRLIAELATLLRDCELPDEARHAGLTLIGWLARRMPGEGPSIVGVEQATRQHVHFTACAGAIRTHAPSPSEDARALGAEPVPLAEAAPMTLPASSARCGAVVARVTASVLSVRKAR
jgi:hypothetical protein